MARSFYDDPSNARVTAVISSPAKASLLRRVTDTVQRSGASRTSVLQDSDAMHCVRLAQEEKLTMALKYVFEQYNRWEGGVNSSRMDKIRFHKVLRCVITLAQHCCQAALSMTVSWTLLECDVKVFKLPFGALLVFVHSILEIARV